MARTTAERYVSKQSGYTPPRSVQKDEIIYPSYYLEFFEKLENIKTLWMEWQDWKKGSGDSPKEKDYYITHYGIKQEAVKDSYIDDELIRDFYNASIDLMSHFDKLKAGVESKTSTSIPNFGTGDINLIDAAIKAGELTLTNGSTYNEMSTLIKTMENVCAHNASDYARCSYCPYSADTGGGSGSGGGTAANSPYFGGGSSSGCVNSPSCTQNCGGYNSSAAGHSLCDYTTTGTCPHTATSFSVFTWNG